MYAQLHTVGLLYPWIQLTADRKYQGGGEKCHTAAGVYCVHSL